MEESLKLFNYFWGILLEASYDNTTLYMYAMSYMVYVATIEWIRWSYIDQNGGEGFLRPTPTNFGFNLKAYYAECSICWWFLIFLFPQVWINNDSLKWI